MIQKQVLLDYNPSELAFRMQELIQSGWEINPESPFTQLGAYWECGLMRDPTVAQLTSDAEKAAKPTRAEILKKARATKAQKAAEREGKSNE